MLNKTGVTSQVLADRKHKPPTEFSNAKRSKVRRLHRMGIVRRQQSISQRSVAQFLQKKLCDVQEQEKETFDLNLSELYRWQTVLDVPIADLLVDPGTPLSRPVLERARLVRLMKTAASILARSRGSGIRRLAQRTIEQLIEIMPELAGIGPWPAVGKPRGVDEFGVAFERRISEDLVRLIHPIQDPSSDK